MRQDLTNPGSLRNSNRRVTLSLTSKLTAAALVAFIILTIGDYLISYRALESNVLNNVVTNISQSSQLINTTVASANNTHGNDLATLQTYFNVMLNPNGNSGIIYIVVGRADGSILMQAGAAQKVLPIPDNLENYSQAAKRGLIHVRDKVLLADNEIGFLQYGVATGDLMHAMEQSELDSLLLTSSVILVCFVGLTMLGFTITRKLSMLKQATQEIAAGHFELRIPEGGGDELSDVAHNFNQMSEAIEAKIREISALNQELELRVQHRTSDLHVANLELENNIHVLQQTRESLVKSEKLASLGAIVAGIAHEINTPIGNALVAASTVNEIVKDIDDKASKGKITKSALANFIQQCVEGTHIIEISLQRASELIQSFKQVAVDQSSERRRQFNLATTIQETVLTLQHTFKHTNFELETDIPADVVLDSYPGALAQILTNLINNSLIHGFEGRTQGRMKIHAALVETKRVKISFSDDGNGIASENLKRIFDPFFTTKFGRGGNGLGLNVVDNITHRILGGRIEVESELGQGSTFILDIPLSAPIVQSTLG